MFREREKIFCVFTMAFSAMEAIDQLELPRGAKAYAYVANKIEVLAFNNGVRVETLIHLGGAIPSLETNGFES